MSIPAVCMRTITLHGVRLRKKTVTKCNRLDILTSQTPTPHPVKQCQPECDERRHAQDNSRGSSRKRKRQRMNVYDVSQLAVAKRIRTRLQLLAFANQQKREGKTDLAEFIANRGPKAVDDALKVAWELEKAETALGRSTLTRMEILKTKLSEGCVDGCSGHWLLLALDILSRNLIVVDDFAGAVRVLLRKAEASTAILT